MLFLLCLYNFFVQETTSTQKNLLEPAKNHHWTEEYYPKLLPNSYLSLVPWQIFVTYLLALHFA